MDIWIYMMIYGYMDNPQKFIFSRISLSPLPSQFSRVKGA